MTDKLSELIEDYYSIVTDKTAKLGEDEIAKQAIIDYVERDKQDAVNRVRNAFVNAINDMGSD